MQVVARNKVLRKGKRHTDLLLKPQSGLFAVIGLVALLLVMLLVKSRAGSEALSTTAESRVAIGQSVTIPTFQSERGYITYKVKGAGQRFWYASVAKRFEICGNWHRIAEMTLEHQGINPNQKAIEEAQYKIETGTEMIIPLAICK